MLHVRSWAKCRAKQSRLQKSDKATLVKQCFWRIRIFSFIASLLFSHFAIAQTGSKSDEQDARATTAVQQPASRSAPVPRIIQFEGWTVSGSLRIRFEDWDFFKAPPADSKYGYGASVLRVNVFSLGKGKSDALFWGAAQTGSWGALRHRANAFAAEAGYQLDNSLLKPWLRAGYFRGSGDDDPSDGVHSTFFQELPTPRPFARFPLYNLMNSEETFAQLTVIPHPKLTLRSEAHSLNLANAVDLWYVGGGAFQKQTFGYTGRPSGGQKRFMTVFDLSADYQFDAQTTFTLYVAHASGKDVVKRLFPAGPNANFAYIELNRRF
jgi:Alginate export